MNELPASVPNEDLARRRLFSIEVQRDVDVHQAGRKYQLEATVLLSPAM